MLYFLAVVVCSGVLAVAWDMRYYYDVKEEVDKAKPEE